MTLPTGATFSLLLHYFLNFAGLFSYHKSSIMAYDVVVLGSGPGGYVAAIRASQLGLKTAIVERENLGGICLNWGCIPTKALLKSGEVYEQLGHLGYYGLKIEGASYDCAKVIERSRGVAKQLSSGVAFLMKKHKIDVFDGVAKL